MMYDPSNSGNSQLPVSHDETLRNMRAGVPARRGTVGVNFTKLDQNTGAFTFGRDKIPVPLDHDYTLPWREVKWGIKEFTGRNVTNTVMRPVAAGPCPMPPGDFAPYGVDGWRACMEIKACSVTEPGFVWVYSSLNESNTSRILDLWGDITAQYAVNREFANPVVRVGVDHYENQFGTTFVVIYEIRAWIADDGTTLLSKVDPAPTPLPGGAEAERPF